MLTIRPETNDDAAVIRAINVSAFKREHEAQLVEALRGSTACIPELSLVAVVGGRAVGHIVFSAIHIRTSDGVVPALALAPMAVHPAFQRQGVGSELVRRGLQECRRLRHRIVVVVGHPHFYPRFGFAPARAQGLEASFAVHDDAFMALALEPGALDGVRGSVEYPPAFSGV